MINIPNFYKGHYQGSPQQEANAKYQAGLASNEEKRKERNRNSSFRSARTYINKWSDIEGLDELEKLIAERRKKLEE